MELLRMLQVTLSIAWKDLRVILKDRGLLFVIIGLPMIMSVFMGTVNQQTTQEDRIFPVTLVNQDNDIFGQQIEKILKDLDVLKITSLDSTEEAKQKVSESQFLAAILIPANLTEQVKAYQSAEIEVVIDPTQAQFATMITGLMKEVVSPMVIQGEISYAIRTLLSEVPAYQQADEGTRRAYEAQSIAVQMAQVQKMQADPWIDVQAQTVDGKEVVTFPTNVFTLMVPSFTVLFAFFIVGDISAELLKDREEGSLRRLIAAPIHPWTIIAGKMLGYIGLVLIQVIVMFSVANLVFDMPLGGSPIGLILVSVAMALAATALGMLVASLARSHRQADSTGLLMGFALGALGGCFIVGSPIPIYKGGGTLETISKFVPQMHALKGYDILLNEGGQLAEVFPEVLILLGYALLFFVIGSRKFRFE